MDDSPCSRAHSNLLNRPFLGHMTLPSAVNPPWKKRKIIWENKAILKKSKQRLVKIIANAKCQHTDTERSPAARFTMEVYPWWMIGLGSSMDSTLISSQSISSFTWLPFTLSPTLCHSPSKTFSTPWKVLSIWLPWGLVKKKSKERVSPWNRRPTCSCPSGSLICHRFQDSLAVSLITLNVAMTE